MDLVTQGFAEYRACRYSVTWHICISSTKHTYIFIYPSRRLKKCFMFKNHSGPPARSSTYLVQSTSFVHLDRPFVHVRGQPVVHPCPLCPRGLDICPRLSTWTNVLPTWSVHLSTPAYKVYLLLHRLDHVGKFLSTFNGRLSTRAHFLNVDKQFVHV
jgi:hypothetical protein